jgi:FkbM family methyltransferase
MLFHGPYIGRCLDLYGEYSESEVDVFRAFVGPGRYAVDVGANIGDLTLPLAHLVGATGRVFAFESHPDNFNVLCANLALNGLRNVKPLNQFVADRPDASTASEGWGRHAYIGDVWDPCIAPLDALALERCDFIKVDVDGKELEVLRSGERTIRAHRPVLYFENDVPARSQELLGYVLETLEYRVFAHAAPIFRPDKFYDNPVNAWAPTDIVSQMMIALPRDREPPFDALPEVESADFSWRL